MRKLRTIAILVLAACSWVSGQKVAHGMEEVAYVKYDPSCMKKLFYRKEGIVNAEDYHEFVLNINDSTNVSFVVYAEINKRRTLKTNPKGVIGCDNRNISMSTIEEINRGDKVGILLEETPVGVLMAPISEVNVMTKSDNRFSYKSVEYDILFDLINKRPIRSLNRNGDPLPYLAEMEVGCKQAFIFQDYDVQSYTQGSTLKYIPDIGAYGKAYHEGSFNLLLVNYGSIAPYIDKLCQKGASFFNKVPNPGMVKNDIKRQKGKTPAVKNQPKENNVDNTESLATAFFDRIEDGNAISVASSLDYPQKLLEKAKATPASPEDTKQLTPKGQSYAHTPIHIDMEDTKALGANSPSAQRTMTSVHTIEKGETLFSISKKYGVTPSDLIVWNGLKTSSIQLGQPLVVSKGVAAQPIVRDVPTPSAITKSVSNSNVSASIHVVAEGETLYSISKKYRTSVEHIIGQNRLHNNTIFVGQKLSISRVHALNL